ncbi:OX-2 membrane glycoproteinglycoprotein-like-like [Podarcis lilfordi]|uniref:OX-2 membrane glycoproteinglycoprotein-like-like n=1 Tax=Podarcis lilfordi TaxID=74358 RepID=A0AA35K8L7_9SAUR|nr:OX-2 membrane glycoproteinglycoprotein-like-like [Podarcis lilfordi]
MRPKLNEGLCSPWTFQGLTLCIICIVLCRIKGAILTSDRDVELGGNATLRCTLTKSLPTVQVTWQQEVNKNVVNLAAYDNNQIPHINDQYKGRVNLTILEFNDTAISFWNVSTQENGCYRCIFNIFPLGSTSKTTCLSVYGRLNTFLHHSISDGRLNATCSATGFPRPNITWVAPRGLKEEHEITNPNGTVSGERDGSQGTKKRLSICCGGNCTCPNFSYCGYYCGVLLETTPKIMQKELKKTF